MLGKCLTSQLIGKCLTSQLIGKCLIALVTVKLKKWLFGQWFNLVLFEVILWPSGVQGTNNPGFVLRGTEFL